MDIYRIADFEVNFYFKEIVKVDFCCFICKDIFDMFLEILCKYYFCIICFFGVF